MHKSSVSKEDYYKVWQYTVVANCQIQAKYIGVF